MSPDHDMRRGWRYGRLAAQPPDTDDQLPGHPREHRVGDVVAWHNPLLAPVLMPPDTDNGAYRVALDKINDIRNSIVGCQCLNWSEHVYPLVAALNEAGIEGLPYPEAKENFGTMFDRLERAESALAALREDQPDDELEKT